MRNKKLFYIVTTIPLSLNFFRGQLAYLSNNFEIVAISSDRDALEKFGETEGIETHCIPMVRSISLLHDSISYQYCFHPIAHTKNFC